MLRMRKPENELGLHREAQRLPAFALEAPPTAHGRNRHQVDKQPASGGQVCERGLPRRDAGPVRRDTS